jgi:ABC-2 type transport system permease protein
MKGAFYWSVRRELWEHRAVWIVPLAVACFALLAFVLALGVGHFVRSGNFSVMPPAQQQHFVMMPFSIAASMVVVIGWVVAAFYCLDALNTERRDRSILFWKSMPVSDLTTVLSKAAIPIVVIPGVAYAIAIATQAALLVIAGIGLRSAGADIAMYYDRLPVGVMVVSFAYGVAVHALWYVPLFALMLLVSVLVRRPFLWIVVPAIVIQVLERIAFGTNFSGAFIKYRLVGAMTEAFTPGAMQHPITQLSQLDPARFFTSPGLWLGLAAAALFLYAATRVRRSKEPLS